MKCTDFCMKMSEITIKGCDNSTRKDRRSGGASSHSKGSASETTPVKEIHTRLMFAFLRDHSNITTG